MLATVPKSRPCAHCQSDFTPVRPLQRVCSPICAARSVKAKNTQERAQFKERKERLKPLRQLLAEAQVPFNAYIRARDADLPCVSCGVVNPQMTTGGQWDAGHFLSRGAHPELRFNEDNCHKQCKSCNAGSGKFAHKERTVSQKFEEELRRRIGDERVDALKGPQPARKWERGELIAIKATYVNRLKELRKEQA